MRPPDAPNRALAASGVRDEIYSLSLPAQVLATRLTPWSAACKVQEGRQGSVRNNLGRNLPFIKHRITRIHTDRRLDTFLFHLNGTKIAKIAKDFVIPCPPLPLMQP